MSARAPTRWVRPLKLTRRDLLKGLQVVGVGAAGAGLVTTASESKTEKLKGTCRLCTMHCGIVATRTGDRLLRIDGDVDAPSRGFLCIHGQSTRELVHAEDRIRRPLKRVGEGFEEITWSRALAEIAERLGAIKADHGAEALAIQTGWPFVRHPLTPFIQRFAAAFGTPNFSTAASFCAVAARMGRALVAGRDFTPDVARTKTLLLWGANPTITAPLYAHHLSAMAKRDRNLVVIDPIKTPLADVATEYLQIRPGTDGALALGLLRVIIDNNWHDPIFIEANVHGFEDLVALTREYPIDRVSALTTIPSAQIERVARMFAREGPSSVWDCLGVEHHRSGTQTVRAIASLSVVCGFIDVPGGSLFEPDKTSGEHGLYRPMTPEPVPPCPRPSPIGGVEYPLFAAFNHQAQSNLYPRAIERAEPYALRGMLLFGSNAALSAPGSTALRSAIDHLDLLVVVDPFLTPTGGFADYVLPASTFAEGPQPPRPGQSGAVTELVPPQHDSRPDWQILFELARAAGLGDYFPWASFEAAMRAPRQPYRPCETATLPAPNGAMHATSTGRLELPSPTLASFGFDPIPRWTPPLETLTPEYPLWLVTGPRDSVFINSQLHNAPSVGRRHEQPRLRLHPRAAAEAGLQDGDRVEVISRHGSVHLITEVSDRVHPEAAVVPAGWARANANQLTSTEGLDPISGFPAFRSGTCRVERRGHEPR